MKIAALYDIHGNLPALNAVLKELEQVQPDRILVGGDIVSGPLPVQVLERLLQLGDQVIWIRGNGDREVASVFDTHGVLELDKGDVTNWVAEQLTPTQRRFLGQLQEKIVLQVGGLGEVLFCHATPRNDYEIFTPISSMDRIKRMFSGVKQQMVICGHTHMQFEMQIGKISVFNAGSVGMPYADQPGAYWLLLSAAGCEFRRTEYDLEQAAEEIKVSSYPHATHFAEENVLKNPTVTEALEALEKMAKEKQ